MEPDVKKMAKDLSREVVKEVRLMVVIAFTLGIVAGWFIGLII